MGECPEKTSGVQEGRRGGSRPVPPCSEKLERGADVASRACPVERPNGVLKDKRKSRQSAGINSPDSRPTEVSTRSHSSRPIRATAMNCIVFAVSDGDELELLERQLWRCEPLVRVISWVPERLQLQGTLEVWQIGGGYGPILGYRPSDPDQTRPPGRTRSLMLSGDQGRKLVEGWWRKDRSARTVQRAWRRWRRPFAKARRAMVAADDAMWDHCQAGGALALPWDLVGRILRLGMRLSLEC